MDRLKEQHIAPAWRDWLANENLDSFETWWRLELEEVDEGNTWRGGWSRVFRFEQKDRRFFVKRQSNHLSHGRRGALSIHPRYDRVLQVQGRIPGNESQS